MGATKHQRRLGKRLHFVSLPPLFINATLVQTIGQNKGYVSIVRIDENG